MKLNHNCIRDFLLYAEQTLDYKTKIFSTDLKLDYPAEELLYTMDKLLEAGYIEGMKKSFIGSDLPQIAITSITWEGHQFMDNIRDDGVWKETKTILGKFSSVSVGIVGNVASQVITSLIQKQLAL